VITPTVVSRSGLLDECKASVAAQTVPVCEHLVETDVNGSGPSVLRNRMVGRAKGDWVLPVDDDDTLDPDYVETIAPYLTADVDVVYSWCRVEGLPDWTPNRLFNDALLLRGNFIPVTACVRKSLVEELGGWPEPPERLQPGEDWELWKLCLGAAAVFKLVPEVLWSYRVQPGSRNRHLAAA
jgi:glycosyltransferase involved in cell wall biosynthesis